MQLHRSMHLHQWPSRPAQATSGIVAALLLLLSACTSPPPAVKGGAVSSTEPPPLQGAARDVVIEELAKFDGPDGPSAMHGTGGFQTASNGERVPYDRYLLVGTSLQQERVREFDAFVDRLEAGGGAFYVFHVHSDGRPAKVLVNLDGTRIVCSRQEW